MQVLPFNFLFNFNLNTIELAQLWDFIEDLTPVMLLVLNWIETEVKLCQQVEPLDELQLAYLHDIVQRKVNEPKRLYVLQATQVPDLIFWKIEQNWKKLSLLFKRCVLILRIVVS